MTYKVAVEKKAAKALEKINEPDYNRVKMAILNLANIPRPFGYIKLKGRDAYRITVGTYRIIYEIIDNRLIVNVVAVGHRKDIYR
jgi:mRNA interferase RelE/StbE